MNEFPTAGEENKDVSLKKEITSSHEKLLLALSQVESQLEGELRSNHGVHSDPPQPYHSFEHSNLVRAKSESVFKDLVTNAPWLLLDISKAEYDKMNSDDQDAIKRRLAVLRAYQRMLAIGHDIVQKSEVIDGKLKRSRGIEEGGNEWESAKKIWELINVAVGSDSGMTQLLGDLNMNEDRVMNDVFATFPEFKSDSRWTDSPRSPKDLQLSQPKLPMATNIGKITALADLYGAYTDPNFEVASLWSDAEFWEMNPELVIKIRNFLASTETDVARENKLKYELQKGIISWLKSQPGVMLLMTSSLDEIIKEVGLGSEYFKKVVASHFPKSNLTKHSLDFSKKSVKITDDISSDTMYPGYISQERLRDVLNKTHFFALGLGHASK